MTYIDNYRALCSNALGNNDDDNDHQLNAALARQIVLAKTNGFCDPSLLLDVYDGTVLTLPQLCKSTAAIVEKRTWTWQQEVSIEEFTQRMNSHEQALPAARNVSDTKVLHLFGQDHPNLASLRRALLQNPYYQTKAIHYFNWDGTCRTANEIQQAILKYPNTRRSMLKIIGLVLAGALTVGTALYMRRSSQQKNDNPRLTQKSDPPKRSQSIPEGGFGQEIGGGGGGGRTTRIPTTTELGPLPSPPPSEVPAFAPPPPPPQTLSKTGPQPSKNNDTYTTRYAYDKDEEKVFFQRNNFAMPNVEEFIGFPDCAYATKTPSISCQQKLIERVKKLPLKSEVWLNSPKEVETFFLAYHDEIMKFLKSWTLYKHFTDHKHDFTPTPELEEAYDRGEATYNENFNPKAYKKGLWLEYEVSPYRFMTSMSGGVSTPNKVHFEVADSKSVEKAYNALFHKHFMEPLRTWYYAHAKLD